MRYQTKSTSWMWELWRSIRKGNKMKIEWQFNSFWQSNKYLMCCGRTYRAIDHFQYTCLICNLFDDEDKDQYHCEGCGICRIGGRNNFFHCEVCNMCLPLQLKTNGHRVRIETFSYYYYYLLLSIKNCGRMKINSNFIFSVSKIFHVQIVQFVWVIYIHLVTRATFQIVVICCIKLVLINW